MESKKTFPTKSTYEGGWNNGLNTMDGFGTYTYPDGSEYRGYFKNGLFEGYGTIRLSPHKFVIRGRFENGNCKYVDEFKFSDGLKFQGKFQKNSNTFDTNKWRYCTQADRRFYDEHQHGIEPVFSQAIMPSRAIPRGTYDTEDGFYQPSTGFITIIDSVDNVPKSRFVNCAKEREWILKNCRHMPKGGYDGGHKPRHPEGDDSRRIIDCNLQCSSEIDDGAICSCDQATERKRYFGNLCQLGETKAIAEDCEDVLSLSDGQSGLYITPSSSSLPSFEEPEVDAEQNEPGLPYEEQEEESAVSSTRSII